MTASATHVFNPRNADMIEEAFERCGVAPVDLNSNHIRSALRSANLVLTDWQNYGYNEYTLVKISQAMTQGDADFTLPAGGYDIFHATFKDGSNGHEREIYPISRSDYNALHDKTQQGEPDRYFVDRSTFTGEDPASTVYLYQTPDSSSDTLEIWYLRKQYDAGTLQNNLDMSPAFYEAFTCGLAFHLSRKFAPERRDTLGKDYLGAAYQAPRIIHPGGALGFALMQNRDTADAVFKVSFDRRRGGR